MVNIPIISISINESIKKFINKLITKNKYDNKSKLVRDALMRLMSSSDISDTLNETDIGFFAPKENITGNMILVAPNTKKFQKRLNNIELRYKKNIVSKSQHYSNSNLIIFLIYEGDLPKFHEIVVDINSLTEVKNFRYMIVK